MKRGEIYYIQHHNATGAEIDKARPGVIVSNDALNQTSNVVEVVYLTTQAKKDMPEHVTIEATGRRSTALCEQINTVSKLRVGAYCGTCSEEEMEAIDQALLASLGLTATEDVKAATRLSDGERKLLEYAQNLKITLDRVITARDRYEKMVDALLAEREGKA